MTWWEAINAKLENHSWIRESSGQGWLIAQLHEYGACTVVAP
jgi:hypothetical protein